MNKAKKFASLFLVLSLLALSGNLIAKERRGADLIITKKDRQQVKGELIAVKESSLLMLVSGVDVSVDVKDIKIIRIVKKSWLLLGAGIGLLIGGGIVATSVHEWELSMTIGDYLANVIGTPIIFTLTGALIGGVAGADKLIQIEGKPDSEVKGALLQLRPKARIPDYQ